MRNKMLDFGVFGKFSEETLLENSEVEKLIYSEGYSIKRYPFDIGDKKDDLSDKLRHLENKKVKGRYVDVVCNIKEMVEIQKELNLFDKLKETIFSLHKKKK